MPKPLFPTTLIVALGAELPDAFQTIRSGSESSTILVLKRWDTPRMRGGKLRFLVNDTTLATLRDFWADAYGSGTKIDFRYPWPDKWYGLYVGIGDGTTTTFDLPGYDTSARTVYKDGTPGSPTYSSGTGENGRDQCIFGTAPASGVLITCDFTGQRMIVAVMGDTLNVVEHGDGAYAVTVTLDEV